MRRRRAEKRQINPDVKYNSQLVTKLINTVMTRGKKTIAEGIVYGAMDIIQEKLKTDPLEVLIQALDNIKPQVEVKSRRVGGANYQVPVEISPDRQVGISMRWITDYAKGRKGRPMTESIANELIDAYNNTGSAVKKRDDTHRMAQANKAFAHYRW